MVDISLFWWYLLLDKGILPQRQKKYLFPYLCISSKSKFKVTLPHETGLIS